MGTDDGRDSAETAVHEDFSVYVAPAWATQAPVPDDESLARLEPTIAIVGVPLLLLSFLFLAALSPFTGRTRIPVGFLGIYPSNTRYIAAAILGVAVGVAAFPYFLASSYFAELFGDRLVVRRGKQEWAVPLEEITVINLITDSLPVSGDTGLLAFVDSLARVGGMPSRFSAPQQNAFVVETTFGLTFPIPPFPGAEEFVTRVYQQRAARLKMRPPVVPAEDPPLGSAPA